MSPRKLVPNELASVFNAPASGDISIQRELIACDTRAGGTLIVGGAIMGGTTYALSRIEVGILGSEAGQETLVVVGIPPKSAPRHAKALAELKEIAADILNVEHRGGKQLDVPREDLPRHAKSWLSGLKRKREKLQQRQVDIDAKIAKIAKTFSDHKKAPTIQIKKHRHANTLAQVGGQCRQHFSKSLKGKHSLQAAADGGTSVDIVRGR